MKQVAEDPTTKLVERRRRGLRAAQDRRAKVAADRAKTVEAVAEVRRAEQRLAEALAQQGRPRSGLGMPKKTPLRPAKAPPSPRLAPVERPSELEALTERATAESRPPLLDPDVARRAVWVLPHGGAYHRRDCHIVDGRSTAREVPSSTARSKGLSRCEHCSPLA